LEDEPELDGHRLLAPQRSVVVEDGDALLRRHRLGRRLGEGDDRLARRRVVPRCERHCPAVRVASSFSTTWSIVKLAARCRGGNAWNVWRNSATTDVAASTRYAWSRNQS